MNKRIYNALLLCVLVFSQVNVAANDNKNAIKTLLSTTTPHVQLANVYDANNDIAVSRYLVSEKFDGVRAIWNGNQFVTRNGNTINAPHWFVDVLPNVWLDGELWTKHQDFASLSGIVRTIKPNDDDWRKVSYRVFDMPDKVNPFNVRYQNYQRLVSNINQPHIVAVKQHQFTSNETLTAYFERTVQQGAEGVMLHLASAKHRDGRSSSLLKLKPYFDNEAMVIAHLPGKGKYQGMLGALRVKNSDGLEFKIGTGFSDAQRRTPPALGATITYRYHGFTKHGLPRFASFLRVRTPE